MGLITISIIQLYVLNIFFSLGSETVITSFRLRSASNESIEMAWNQAKYTPISMGMEIKCRFLCDDEWYLTSSYNLIPTWTRMNVKALKPGSICAVRFLVVYNPAGYDRGFQRHYTTLSASKMKHSCIFHAHTNANTHMHLSLFCCDWTIMQACDVEYDFYITCRQDNTYPILMITTKFVLSRMAIWRVHAV